MKAQLKLRCRCGEVRGVAKAVSPRSGNHIVCYCSDCQALARFLARADLVDESGGSEIFQLTPAQLELSDGMDRVRCMKLSEKGMLRWYAECCKTPIANTASSARLPFAGMHVAFVDPTTESAEREAAFGPVILRSVTEDATGSVPPGAYATRVVAILPRILALLARGLVGRKHQPSPFFAPGSKAPRVPPRVLTPSQRAGLANG